MDSGINRPRQARSERTRRRIVAAARELLEGGSFDELGVARIARRARSSVGAFYGRFPDKQALLLHLAEVYAEEARQAMQGIGRRRGDERGEADGTRGARLAAEVRSVVGFVVGFHRERAGLVRALLLEARARPAGRVAESVRRMKGLPTTLERRILEHRAAIGHPEPARAVAEGFFVVLSAVRERVVFGVSATAEGGLAGDGDLVELLSACWLAVLRPTGEGAGVSGTALYSA
jgi:AcrR family transcriptional regulator